MIASFQHFDENTLRNMDSTEKEKYLIFDFQNKIKNIYKKSRFEVLKSKQKFH